MPIVLKSGSLNLLEPSGPVQACNGIGLPLLTPYLLNSMQLSPFWDANRFAASQEIPPHFIEPEVSLPHSQVPATCPYPEPDRPSPYPNIPLPEDLS